MLHFTARAYSPVLDSTVLVFGIIGQILTMQRRVENRAFRLLVNTIAVPLYFSRGLHLTSLLHAGFWPLTQPRLHVRRPKVRRRERGLLRALPPHIVPFVQMHSC